MTVLDTQMGKLMSEYEKHGNIPRASMMAGMDRKTGRKYLRGGMLPSERKKPDRNYQTRPDSFTEHWKEVCVMLTDAPALKAKALFVWLLKKYSDQYTEGQLRTFQRKVRRWRATEGPDKRVIFGQCAFRSS